MPEKLYIVGQLELGLMSLSEAITQYNLSPKLLRAWRRLHLIKKYKPRTVSKPKKTDAQKLAEAERKIKEMEKELKWQTLRANTLDRFIDISEEMLNIKIRKKPGTKQ